MATVQMVAVDQSEIFFILAATPCYTALSLSLSLTVQCRATSGMERGERHAVNTEGQRERESSCVSSTG